MSLCELREICYRYENRWILYKANLSIQAGDFIALTGKNGVGKTTILKLISSLERPTYGSIIWGKPHRVLGVQLGDSYLYNELTVSENLQLFANMYKLSNQQTRVMEMLELFQMIDMRDKLFKHLSKGYQKRVSIARALIHKPDMLLLDEPFDGLDDISAKLLQFQLKELNERGMTIIFVSHIKSFVDALATKIYKVENQGIIDSEIEKRLIYV
ncbi:ABC transporter ATP-binding protein [Schinkia azotoformans]|uniref:ABC transporter ATP-binding protein n=1 Tax=Schinkia azotoformans TaxID=1454 RepID=UPI002DB565BB|nr:ABC transporter ATP-binding protein [Schinkia azotoformans]MEC1742803.1 ABC transporter ATP-binding protein [Schinkia azotoformans]MEC1769024.1 ABC transporter ATP-binding protein [Schinkia azotoformans]MEC1789609.1 ABC transporter ATP-binding protein [Schinkia azotoformans]MED4378434.1 ABC transporter ATP-binding protein [Schinkia azotoformans]MED4417423.1 ABC transporter ATP-binding protein [Schinkia azotoformans]